VLFYFAREAAGAAEAPGIPCTLCFVGGAMFWQNSGESRCGNIGAWLFEI
jgi:hypothetical protein